MEKRNGEIWWLVALEATLFWSLPCWELTAPWAAPLGHSWRRGVLLVLTSVGAMLLCHVSPALLAARYNQKWPGLSWILVGWLGLGYLEWLGSVVRTIAEQIGPPAWFLPAFLLLILLVWRQSRWRLIVALELFLGVGLLAWAVVTNWHGLSMRNVHLTAEPVPFDGLLVKGILVSAAPAVVIGWRIGRLASRPAHIWWSGLAGVCLPAVLSVTLASLATEAGMNLYWRPSLSRGFHWALLGPHGRAEERAIWLATGTLLGPALVTTFSLQTLTPASGGKLKTGLLLALVCLLSLAVPVLKSGQSGILSYDFVSTLHEFWAGSLVVFGAVAGLSYLFWQRSPSPR